MAHVMDPLRGSEKVTASAKAVGFSQPSERLLGLLRQHDRLLADVARKRKVLDRARDEVVQVAAEVARRLEPIIEESRRIDAEVHGLFAELLKRPKLPKHVRHAIRGFYEELQEKGILSERSGAQAGNPAAAASGGMDQDDDGRDEDDGDPGDAGPRSSGRRNDAGDRVPSAAPAGANPTLRGLFLRLARALHPDRVQDARERADRTETMKEVNRAYRDGDVARLAELERQLKARGAFIGPGGGAGEPAGGGDDLDKKCAALEETNRALHQQLKGLRRDLRALRDSEMGRLAADVERRRQRGKVNPFADLDADADAEIRGFRRLRDHVRAFRDGAISLETFLKGPPDEPDDEDADVDLAFDLIEDLAARIARESQPPFAAPRPRKRPRRR